MTKSRPILITYSILAGLGVITAASGLGDLLGMKVAFVIILGREAVQAGLNFYVQGQVTPVADVGAYVSSEGKMVAGPASGTSNGAAVAVVPTDAKVSDEQIRAAQLVARKALSQRDQK